LSIFDLCQYVVVCFRFLEDYKEAIPVYNVPIACKVELHIFGKRIPSAKFCSNRFAFVETGNGFWQIDR